jgi:hypothetical protein
LFGFFLEVVKDIASRFRNEGLCASVIRTGEEYASDGLTASVVSALRAVLVTLDG